MVSFDVKRMKQAAIAAGGLEWSARKEDYRAIVASDGRPCAGVIGGGHDRPYSEPEKRGISSHLVESNPAAILSMIDTFCLDSDEHPFVAAVRCAASLRGMLLHSMPGGYFAVYKNNGAGVYPLAAWITIKDVARLCGATKEITLREAAERDGFAWPIDGCLPGKKA